MDAAAKMFASLAWRAGVGSFRRIFDGVEGALIDNGLLQPIEDGPKDRGEERIAVLSEEIVFRMLKARDFGQIPQDEISSPLITAAEPGRRESPKALGMPSTIGRQLPPRSCGSASRTP